MRRREFITRRSPAAAASAPPAGACGTAFLPSSTSPMKRKPLRAIVLIRVWSEPVSPIACRTALMRLVSVELGNDSPFPDGVEQIILADHPCTVVDQVDEQIEDLRSDIDQLGAAPQLAAILIYRIFTELKWHSGLLLRRWRRGRPRRRKSRAISGVNQVRVKALRTGLRHRRTRSARWLPQ